MTEDIEYIIDTAELQRYKASLPRNEATAGVCHDASDKPPDRKAH